MEKKWENKTSLKVVYQDKVVRLLELNNNSLNKFNYWIIYWKDCNSKYCKNKIVKNFIRVWSSYLTKNKKVSLDKVFNDCSFKLLDNEDNQYFWKELLKQNK
jgi:hypothetical protein